MENGLLTEIQWSNYSNTCAAIDEYNNIRIFNHNNSNYNLPFSNQGKITTISWSYQSDILAIGTSNSILTLFSNKTQKNTSIQIKDFNQIIEKIVWNKFSEEICLISNDNQIIVMNINEDLEVSTVFSSQINFSFQNVTFLNKSEILLNNKEGEIYLISKDSQKYLTTMLIPVSFIYCTNAIKNQIITISSDNIFSIFQLTEKVLLKKLDQRKLNDGKFTHIEEMPDGNLIYSIDDTIFLMKNDFESIELKIQKDDRITDFHFYSYANTLTAITEKGMICVWSISEKIQLIQKLNTDINHSKSFWSSYTKAVVAVDEPNKLFSIFKLPKISYVNNSFYFELLQIDANTLLSNSNRRIQSGQMIKRIRQSSNHFLIMTYSDCEIYNFKFECICQCPIQSSLVEIFGSRIFILKGKKIESRNIVDNISINSIELDSDGLITKSSVNGSFLVVLTSSNEVFAFDISKFSMRQISKVNLSDFVGVKTVTSIGVSCGGFCISVNCRSQMKRCNPILISAIANGESPKIIELNEKGKLKWDTETPNLFCIQGSGSLLLTYLVDADLKLFQLKSLKFPQNNILLKVSVPRFFHSPQNASGFNVTSSFLPAFLCLDEAPVQLKRSIVKLMLGIQNENFEMAVNLIQEIDDKTVLQQFLSENKLLNLFSDKIQLFDSKQHDYEPAHRCLMTGDLSVVSSMSANDEKEAKKWMGRFSESKNDTKSALLMYSASQNHREQLRLLCLERKFAEAKQLVDQSADKSDICYFARLLMKYISSIEKVTNDEEGTFFESKEKVANLIVDLFLRAERYGAAFEFAAGQNMVSKVEELAAAVPRKLLYKVANYYETKKVNEMTSLHLYLYAGLLSKAAHFAQNAFNIEKQDLSDLEVIYRCAEICEEKENYEEAVIFYGYSKSIEKVATLCKNHDLKLPQIMLNFFIANPNESVASLLNQQRRFLQASQIYSKLNMKDEAVKSLISLNDVEKVIELTKEVDDQACYALSADYIAVTFNPNRKSPLFQLVVEFYSKSGEFEKISNFLETRAQSEISERQNYEIALDLLRESQNWLAKSSSSFSIEENEKITKKIRWIEIYLEAVNSDSSEMSEVMCNELLNAEDAFDVVRYDDVVFLLLKKIVDEEDFVGAKNVLDKMKSRGVDASQFMETESIMRIYRAAECNNNCGITAEVPKIENVIERLYDY